MATLKTGEKTFQELARTHSDDKTRRATGGDLGVVPLHHFFPPVARAAWSLKPGETTGVMKTQGSFKIVKRY